MFRTKINNLPLAQVRSLVAGITPAVAQGASEDLTGSVFDLVLDDEPVRAPRLRYEITGPDTLLYAEDGRAPLPCPCAVLTLKDMVLFTHAVPDAMKAYVVMLSRKTGIATVYELWYIDYGIQRFVTILTDDASNLSNTIKMLLPILLILQFVYLGSLFNLRDAYAKHKLAGTIHIQTITILLKMVAIRTKDMQELFL